MAIKGIYYADPTTHEFTHSDIVEDDYQLQANETFENPTGKREPAKLVGTSWQDATEEEHAAWVKQQEADFKRLHPDTTPAGPTAGKQALNALGLQVASLTAENKQLKQSVNVLGLQVAQAIAKDNKENGGN